MSEEIRGDINLEKLITLAHKVAAPYKFCVWLLAVLLLISVLGNVYLATRTFNISFDADYNTESDIDQINE